MRTFTAITDTDTLPDLDYLAAVLLCRPNVMDVVIHRRNAMRVITESQVFGFSYYTDRDSIVWSCNVY